MLILNDMQPRGLGYVEIDQRAVGGELPPGTAPYFEADTYTCRHCERVVILNPARVRERYKCNGCSHHICDDCAAKRAMGENCKPYVQQVEENLELAARQVDSGLIIMP